MAKKSGITQIKKETAATKKAKQKLLDSILGGGNGLVFCVTAKQTPKGLAVDGFTVAHNIPKGPIIQAFCQALDLQPAELLLAAMHNQ